MRYQIFFLVFLVIVNESALWGQSSIQTETERFGREIVAFLSKDNIDKASALLQDYCEKIDRHQTEKGNTIYFKQQLARILLNYPKSLTNLSIQDFMFALCEQKPDNHYSAVIQMKLLWELSIFQDEHILSTEKMKEIDLLLGIWNIYKNKAAIPDADLKIPDSPFGGPTLIGSVFVGTDEEKKGYDAHLEKVSAIYALKKEKETSQEILKEYREKLIEAVSNYCIIKHVTRKELKDALTYHNIAPDLMKDIVDPLNTILQMQEDGFRIWQSADGLLKVTAKMVSSDKKEVKLEKADGDTLNVELHKLRKEDQEYVKLQSEIEASKEEQK